MLVVTHGMADAPQAKRRKTSGMPAVGFGTYKLGPDNTEECVAHALKVGYRLIDTAQIYKNEKPVGKALKESGLERGDVFITTKVWRSNHGYQKCRESVLKSLKDLGLDYIDCALIHYPDCKRGWPLRRGETNPPDWHPSMRKETWRALEDMLLEGLIRRIGVSNYAVKHLQELEGCRVKPFLNQVELHPLLQQKALVEYCRQHGILLQAFASLGGGDQGAPLLHNPKVRAVAREVGKTPAQVLLKWALQKKFSVIPKTKEKTRMEANFESSDVKLTGEHMSILDSLEQGARLTWKQAVPDNIQ